MKGIPCQDQPYTVPLCLYPYAYGQGMGMACLTVGIPWPTLTEHAKGEVEGCDCTYNKKMILFQVATCPLAISLRVNPQSYFDPSTPH